jgi:hypothetical protein
MARGMAAIEAKAGAQSARLADAFGSQVAGELAERAPASDLRRLLVYAEHADSALAKDLLAKAYKEEGASLFSRIGPGHVLAGGLSAAAIVGVHRGTAPLVAVARSIDESPELASDAARLSVWWFWGDRGRLSRRSGRSEARSAGDRHAPCQPHSERRRELGHLIAVGHADDDPVHRTRLRNSAGRHGPGVIDTSGGPHRFLRGFF